MKIITLLILLLTFNVTLAQEYMPVAHTLTDKKERTLQGVILSKSDTHITFSKEKDGKQ